MYYIIWLTYVIVFFLYVFIFNFKEIIDYNIKYRNKRSYLK